MRRSAWSRSGLTCSPAPSRTNLRYGKPDATDDELWEALEIAQAADFVARDARRPRHRRRPGRHQPSPAASGSGWPSPGPWYDDRRSTSSTTPSRRWTSPPTPGCGRRSRRVTRDATVVIVAPAHLHHPRRRPDPRARGRAGGRSGHPRGAAARTTATYQRDRRLARHQAERRSRHEHDRRSTTAERDRSSRAGPAAGRAAAWSARRPTNFGRSGAIACSGCCARRGAGRSPYSLLGIGCGRAAVAGRPVAAGQGDRRWSSTASSAASSTPSTTKADRRSRRREASGDGRLADLLSGHRPSCPAGASTSTRSDTVLLIALRDLRRRGRCSAGCRATSLNDVVQADRAADAQRRRGEGSPAAAVVLRHASRAASCSAGSPTTSTTSRRTSSRR